MELPKEIYIKKYSRILAQLQDKLPSYRWKAKKNRRGNFWMFYVNTSYGRILAIPEEAAISEKHLKVSFVRQYNKKSCLCKKLENK
jgi:hypothetical protein